MKLLGTPRVRTSSKYPVSSVGTLGHKATSAMSKRYSENQSIFLQHLSWGEGWGAPEHKDAVDSCPPWSEVPGPAVRCSFCSLVAAPSPLVSATAQKGHPRRIGPGPWPPAECQEPVPQLRPAWHLSALPVVNANACGPVEKFEPPSRHPTT